MQAAKCCPFIFPVPGADPGFFNGGWLFVCSKKFLFRFLVTGEKANVIITVAGNEKINKKTLKLDLLREDGALIG